MVKKIIPFIVEELFIKVGLVYKKMVLITSLKILLLSVLILFTRKEVLRLIKIKKKKFFFLR